MTNEKADAIVKDFFDLATMSWNPENFVELEGLMKLQYPDLKI